MSCSCPLATLLAACAVLCCGVLCCAVLQRVASCPVYFTLGGCLRTLLHIYTHIQPCLLRASASPVLLLCRASVSPAAAAAGPMPAGHPSLATARLPHQASAAVPAGARAGGGTHVSGQLATAARQSAAVLTHCNSTTRPGAAAAGRQAPPTAVQRQLGYARQRLPDVRRGSLQQQPNAPGRAAGGRNVT